jgi:hypothetical protein
VAGYVGSAVWSDMLAKLDFGFDIYDGCLAVVDMLAMLVGLL